MKKHILLALAVGCASAAVATTPQAAETRLVSDSPYSKTHEITVVFGIGRGFAMAPKELHLVTGRMYRLVIKNPSPATHYFWAPEFGGYAAWTDRISVDKGKVGLRTVRTPGNQYSTWEIKILPGGTAVWSFVPEVAGLYKLGCSHPAHVAAGMTGVINVKPDKPGNRSLFRS